jgi:RecA-family ATPase
LTGTSKIGKSWICLQLNNALDQGGYFLGTLKAEKTDCLYCALEDTEKRIQKRIKKQGILTFNGSRLETKRRTVENLRAFLKSNTQYRVVIIDTFQKMMGISDLNDYAKTVNGMSALKAIADDLNRAVIVIHHNRKSSNLDGDHMESALGSTGINATADCTLTMRRKRGDAQAIMQVSGRDVEDTSYTMAWDKDCCSWTITEKEALKPSIPEAQQAILDILSSEDREWATAEIIEK